MSPSILNRVPSLGSAQPLAIGGATICLCMIVKDEASVIRRCLESVKPHIHAACIVDTGSTDGTIEEILAVMDGVPGEIHRRPWVDFASNRNEAFEFAREMKTSHIMVIDADEVLQTLPIPSTLPADVYTAKVESQGRLGERVFLVRSDYPKRWVGEIHEDLEQHGLWKCAPGVLILSHDDGARAKDPDRYNRDLKILFQMLQRDPANTRALFYLGATYFAAGDLQQAKKAFELRTQRIGDLAEWAMAIDYLQTINRRLP